MARNLATIPVVGALALSLVSPSVGRTARDAGTDRGEFEAWMAAVPAVEDTFETAPLAAFLMTTLAGRDAGDSTDLVTVSRTVLQLRRELATAEPGSSRVWMMKAYTLAGALNDLGATRGARHWYARIARREGSVWPELARRELTRVAALWNDRTTLDSMASDWRGDAEEIFPALTLCSALYVKEMNSTLLRFLGAIGTPEFAPYGAFFRGVVAYEQGVWDRASGQLAASLREAGDSFPAGLRLAALLRLAETSRRRGRAATATARYTTLSGARSPYVKSWATFMLGNLSLAAGDLGEATRRFEQVCGHAPGMQWAPVACLLNEGLVLEAEVRRQSRR